MYRRNFKKNYSETARMMLARVVVAFIIVAIVASAKQSRKEVRYNAFSVLKRIDSYNIISSLKNLLYILTLQHIHS